MPNDPPIRSKLAEYEEAIVQATAAFQDEMKRIEQAHKEILTAYEQQIAAANADLMKLGDAKRLLDRGTPARGLIKRLRAGTPSEEKP